MSRERHRVAALDVLHPLVDATVERGIEGCGAPESEVPVNLGPRPRERVLAAFYLVLQHIDPAGSTQVPLSPRLSPGRRTEAGVSISGSTATLPTLWRA
jgi:hypothetical protein